MYKLLILVPLLFLTACKCGTDYDPQKRVELFNSCMDKLAAIPMSKRNDMAYHNARTCDKISNRQALAFNNTIKDKVR